MGISKILKNEAEKHSELKELIDGAIEDGFKELFLPLNLMREAISWLSSDKPQTERLQLFSKDKTLLLVVSSFEEVNTGKELLAIMEGGRSDQEDYLWEIDNIQNDEEMDSTKFTINPLNNYTSESQSDIPFMEGDGVDQLDFEDEIWMLNMRRAQHGFRPMDEN